jgi:hypothetical protein
MSSRSDSRFNTNTNYYFAGGISPDLLDVQRHAQPREDADCLEVF